MRAGSHFRSWVKLVIFLITLRDLGFGPSAGVFGGGFGAGGDGGGGAAAKPYA